MKKLLAVILTLVMALSLCSVSWADGEAAEIDGKQYATLEAAFDAAKSGDTVKVLQNTEVNTVIYVRSNQSPITLDLASSTVTVKASYGFFVLSSGSLVVSDSAAGGTIRNGNKNSSALIQVNGGSLEVKGGTLERENAGSGYVIFVNSNGKATFSGGKIKAATTIQPAVYANNEAEFVKITGGEIESDDIAVYAAFTPVTMTAGTVKGECAFWTRNTTIEPADGAEVKVEADYAAFYTFDDSNNVVKGGSVEAPAVTAAYTGEEDTGLAVSGGTFSSDVTNYLTEEAVAATVVTGGSAKYAVGAAAISAAITSDSTVKVTKGSIDLASVPAGVTVENEGTGSVTVNGKTVEQGKSYTTPTYYYSPSTPAITAELNGANKSATDYTSGDYGLVFRSTAAFSTFQGVQVDGKTLDKSSYTAEEGSTVVYLKAVYLRTLAAGKHTVTILSSAGNTSMDFTVGGKTTAPQTFDAGIALYVGMALTSAAGMAFVGRKRED